MISVDFTGVIHKEFEPFKPGKNKVYVNGIKQKETATGDKKFLEVQFTDGHTRLTERIYLTDASKWRLQEFLKACQLPHTGKVEIAEEDILSRHLIIECVAEAYKKDDGTTGTSIKVKKFLADPDITYNAVEEKQAEEDIGSDDLPY